MAAIEFINRKNKTYQALRRVINYILREDKTKEELIYAEKCRQKSAYEDFIQVKREFEKESGRQYIHFVQSFSPEEKITPEIAQEIARKLITHPIFEGFQIVMATHIDTPHIHTHFVVNTVNSVTGMKWHLSKEDLQTIKNFSDQLCREYGLNVIDNQNKTKGHKKGSEYRSEQKGCSWKYELFLVVKQCLQLSYSREDFISRMKKLDYDVLWDDQHKYVTFTTPEGKKCRNRKLYPPERFTKEAMEAVFEKNRQFMKQRERDELWNNLITALAIFQSKQKPNSSGKYPLSSLEGEALKEYMLLHDNEGEIDWGNELGEENDFEV